MNIYKFNNKFIEQNQKKKKRKFKKKFGLGTGCKKRTLGHQVGHHVRINLIDKQVLLMVYYVS